MTHPGFKVVRAFKKRLVSCWMSRLTLDPQVCLEYSTEDFAVRQYGQGPLACFPTLQDAKDFVNGNSHANPHPSADWIIFHCEYTLSKDRYLWYKPGSLRPKRTAITTPPKTIFADCIRLTMQALPIGA